MNDYNESKNNTLQAKIMLNGNDRFATRKGDYFSLVQPYQHHENTPDVYHSGINVYSFALKPEEHQPSGTLNMSRIDTAVLNVSSKLVTDDVSQSPSGWLNADASANVLYNVVTDDVSQLPMFTSND